MTPIRLSDTWSRRLYVGLFLLSLVYIILFALQYFGLVSTPQNLQIPVITAVGALLAAIGSGIAFFIIKRATSFLPAFIIFSVFTIATAYVVQQTGGVHSSFLAIWTLLVFFAAMFGAYGWLPALVMIASYMGGAYLSNQFTPETIILIIFSSLVPLIAGMIIWRDPPGVEDASQKNVKKLATQLSEVATKSEIVINAIGDGVIAVDGKGTIQLINPAAQEILGWGKQDALMLSYKSIFKLADLSGVDLPDDKDPVQQVLNTNQQARNSKIIAVTQSGKKINVAVVVSPIGNPGSGAITVFRDITNDRAEEREQAEFISTASHEMRTPVASIEGYLGLALNPNTATIDAKARDFIMKAHEAAQHLGRLFQDLLDVSKSEDGRMTSDPKVVDLVTYTATITEGLTQKAKEKGLQLVFKPLSTSTERKIMPVYFVNQDNDHIREIIDNLIENAIKYTPTGTVTVDVTGNEDRVMVSVQDTGLGIPPEDLPHLFQKFYRVDNVDRQAIGGTGLGLYLSRRLAEAMQGRLWVESTFENGSTFFLELPRIDSQEAARIKEEQEHELTKPLPTVPVAKSIPVTTAPAPVASTTPQPVVVTAMPVNNGAQVAAPVPNTVPVTTPVAQAPQQPGTYATVSQPAPGNVAPMLAVSTTAPLSSAAPRQASATAPLSVPAPVATSTPAPATPPSVRPATTVPRGESLSREQIAERVRQLEALSQQQRNTPPGRQ